MAPNLRAAQNSTYRYLGCRRGSTVPVRSLVFPRRPPGHEFKYSLCLHMRPSCQTAPSPAFICLCSLSVTVMEDESILSRKDWKAHCAKETSSIPETDRIGLRGGEESKPEQFNAGMKPTHIQTKII